MSILKALVDHYEDLLCEGKVGRFGWSDSKITYALYLDEDGTLLDLISLREEVQRGKKTFEVPQMIQLPTPAKRSSSFLPNFMWDNSAYILGIDNKGNPERAADCFKAARDFHERLLSPLKTSAANAVRAYFRSWDPEKAREHPAIQPILDDVISGCNFCFIAGDQYAHEDLAIRQAWQEHYEKSDDAEEGVCLVTGERTAIARLHPSIKGVPGGQATGTSLVSFNAPSFCSYDKEQGAVAPTGRYAAFAYGVALNHLIADREHANIIGDTMILSWATGGEPQYQEAFSGCIFGNGDEDNEMLGIIIHDLIDGKRVDYHERVLDPEKKFYVLGVTANAGRLVVRFFFENSFGRMLQSVEEHQRRMEIIAPSFDVRDSIPLWQILRETVNQKATDTSPQPELANRMANAIINNTPYPSTIVEAISIRIRADKEINRTRAAMIKAYYLKNTHKDVPKEVLTVALNPDSNSVPYNLGRLFSVLEDVQAKALPGLNATIKDRYFNGASATPGRVFPILVNLTQAHLHKIKSEGTRVYYAKLINEIMDNLGEEYPIRFNLAQQGAFQLGYYHQTQQRYIPRKKDEDADLTQD